MFVSTSAPSFLNRLKFPLPPLPPLSTKYMYKFSILFWTGEENNFEDLLDGSLKNLHQRNQTSQQNEEEHRKLLLQTQTPNGFRENERQEAAFGLLFAVITREGGASLVCGPIKKRTKT